MAYGAKTYTLREESTESGKRYFISFKDRQGEYHELEVSEQLFIEFRQMERRNRDRQQWNQRHREFNEVWDETLYKRALRVPKTLDEKMMEKNGMKYSLKQLPDCQRYKGGVSYSITRMISTFTKSPRWSIAPLPQFKNPFQLQRKRSRQK